MGDVEVQIHSVDFELQDFIWYFCIVDEQPDGFGDFCEEPDSSWEPELHRDAVDFLFIMQQLH